MLQLTKVLYAENNETTGGRVNSIVIWPYLPWYKNMNEYLYVGNPSLSHLLFSLKKAIKAKQLKLNCFGLFEMFPSISYIFSLELLKHFFCS